MGAKKNQSDSFGSAEFRPLLNRQNKSLFSPSLTIRGTGAGSEPPVVVPPVVKPPVPPVGSAGSISGIFTCC
jgi:hypothetical protein